MGQGVSTGVIIRTRGLKFEGDGSWCLRLSGKTENRGKTGMFGKKGWEMHGTRLKGMVPPWQKKLSYGVIVFT